MLVMGHAGITLGIIALLGGALSRGYARPTRMNREIPHRDSPSQDTSKQDIPTAGMISGIAHFIRNIDARVLLIGSLFPDIIDKPVGNYLFRDTVSSGRIVCHTLLFFILVTILGVYLYRSRKKAGLLAISFGVFTHLILDQMWRAPKTLLWPIFGFAFDRVDLTNWLPNMIRNLMTDPAVYIPELVGMAGLVWFALVLVRKRRVFEFLKSGRVLN